MEFGGTDEEKGRGKGKRKREEEKGRGNENNDKEGKAVDLQKEKNYKRLIRTSWKKEQTILLKYEISSSCRKSKEKYQIKVS